MVLFGPGKRFMQGSCTNQVKKSPSKLIAAPYHIIDNKVIELCTINRPFDNTNSNVTIQRQSWENTVSYTPIKRKL
jgi:hypothetical protein